MTVQASEAPDNVTDLCRRLGEIKRIPYRMDTVADDPVYDGLIANGVSAVPCLVNEITNTSPARDPREAPHILDYTVGDSAVFLLHRIANIPLEEILTTAYQKDWDARGVYAYFRYVEKPEHRKQIQIWWKNWMKENLTNKPKAP